MTATPYGWAPADSGTTWAAASWSTSLLSLANGAATVSPSIDNTEVTVTTAAYDEGWLQIDLGASTALGTTLPITVGAVPLDALDGTNYTPSFVASAVLYPLEYQRTQSYPASISTRYLHVRGILLRPCLMKIALINNTGVAFPASGVTATFYRLRRQAG